MAILELFSDRQKKERGEVPEVFAYDQLPQRLRVQIDYIVQDALGSYYREGYETAGTPYYKQIVATLCRHFGLNQLAEGSLPNEQLSNFLQSHPDITECLDAIEVSFRVIATLPHIPSYDPSRPKLTPTEAINALNKRFLQNAVGYQFVSGKIIRTDSQFAHAEIIKPALVLLQDKRYAGANDEFLKAYEHYRKGEIKGCLANSLSAYESTLKTICGIRGWAFQPKDTAKTLLNICFDKGLVPPDLRSHYSALQSTLESGVPTLRNKRGGHGQGAQVVNVPPYFASYALHLTGSAMLFLIEAEKNLP